MYNPNLQDFATSAAKISAEEEGKLPFDPPTVLIGLWRRRKIFAIIVIMFSVLGVVAALLFGQKTYEAESVLIYRPTDIDEGETESNAQSDPKALYTQMNMVKILSNLEETKRRLNLGASPGAIGRAAKAEVQRNTKLLTIRVRWGTPKEAADIANTLREVFLDNQRNIRHTQAKEQIVTLEQRLEYVQEELATASKKLSNYTEKHNIINVDVETQYLLQELSSVEMLYGQTRSDLTTNELQLQNVEAIIEELKTKKGGPQIIDQGSIDQTNRRIEQIESKIESDRAKRAKSADLAKAELDYERAKKLWDKGLIPKSEFDAARISYDKQKAMLEDTDEMSVWKNELTKLQQQALTMQVSSASPGGSLSDEMMVRAINLRLETTALKEKVKHLEAERNRVRAKLDRMPNLERSYVEYSSEVASKELERDKIKAALNRARRASASQTTDFGLIAEAKPPTASRSSNRKILAGGLGIIGVLFGFLLILGLELLDTTIKSTGELGVKVSLPILGSLATVQPEQPHFPGQEASAPFEPFNIITRRIRQAIPKKGARILLVSAKPGEGKTWIAINMALSMGRRDERVLLSDAQVRSAEEQREVYDQIHKASITGKIKDTLSLSDGLLSDSQTPDGTNPDEESTQVATIELPDVEYKDESGAGYGNNGAMDYSSPSQLASSGENLKGKMGESLIGLASKLAAWFDERFDTILGTETRIEHSSEDRHDIRDLILYDGKALKGIGEYLSYDAESLDDVVWPTLLRGVEVLPRFGSAVVPDLLASSRMREFLEEVSNEFSIVLIDGPAVFPFVDADLLAQLSDAIVFVVRSRYTNSSLINKALEQIQESGVPVIGTILNDVDPAYQDKG